MSFKRKDLISYRTRLETIKPYEVGGKGWNLFCLRKHGFPVPPWIVVSNSVFNLILRDYRKDIEEILRNLNFACPTEVDAAELRIRELIFRAKIPAQFSIELKATLTEIFPEQSFLSVRSSVVGEDSLDHSFAGLMDSFLNVPRHEVQEAIRKVWSSAFSTRALVYRNRKKISLKQISTAVVIQEMVQAEASGVLFTQEPGAGDKRCAISAGYGLGEGVVSNRVESDSYTINWVGKSISRNVAGKEFRVCSSTKGGCHIEPLPFELRTREVLSPLQIERLRDVGVKAEKYFAAPQDIEWAFDSSGSLFILQARPIVGDNHTYSPPSRRVWDNSNVVESYPGLTLPLTFTFIRDAYETNFRNTANSFLLFKKGLQERFHIFKNMIGLLDGRVYYNLLSWYEMLSFLPGFKKHKDSWDQMIGITKRVDVSKGRLSPLNNIFALLFAAWKLFTVKRTARKFFAHFEPIYAYAKNVNVSEASEEELVGFYQSFTHRVGEKWHLTAHNDFCAMTFYGALKILCDRWGLSEYPNLQNDLLCGESNVESILPVRSLVQLAEIFRAKKVYGLLLEQPDDIAVWTRIQRDPALASLKDALENHLRMYGDRTLEELKLETPSLQDRPEHFIGMIREYFHTGLSVKTMVKHEREIREKAEEFVRINLKNVFKRCLFRFVLKNARIAIANRENMRFARSRVFGVVKRIFKRIGVLFTEKGIIDSSSDIYYLTVDEVWGFVEGTAVTQNLKALIKIRKKDYHKFALRVPKERIETTGIPYLNSLYGPKSNLGLEKSVKGIGCSTGVAEGKARIVADPHGQKSNGNQILVAKSTDPGWVFLIVSSKGIIVEKGSVLSHTAIIGRELGIPTIVGVKNATELIPEGVNLSINGSTGEAWWQ